MAEPVKLAVFDCDGTLVDSQHAINACMADAFSAVNLLPPPLASVRQVVGLPLAKAIAVLAADETAPINDMTAAYSRSWTRMRDQGALIEPLYDGTLDVLAELEAGGWVLGVATGKSMRGLRATLEHHTISGRFSTLQTADYARGKPDPEMLYQAMQETGADPRDTVMIGDTTYDIEMALAAGVRPIGVAWGYHRTEDLLRAGASVVASTVLDLGRIVQFAEETA